MVKSENFTKTCWKIPKFLSEVKKISILKTKSSQYIYIRKKKKKGVMSLPISAGHQFKLTPFLDTSKL